MPEPEDYILPCAFCGAQRGEPCRSGCESTGPGIARTFTITIKNDLDEEQVRKFKEKWEEMVRDPEYGRVIYPVWPSKE